MWHMNWKKKKKTKTCAYSSDVVTSISIINQYDNVIFAWLIVPLEVAEGEGEGEGVIF